MRSRRSTFKAMVIAAMLALGGLVGIAQQAQALQYNAGDAVLVIYGNGTEYYRNLGSASTLQSSGANITINQSFMSQLGGANQIEYTILGGNAANFGALPTSTFEGSLIPSTNISLLSGWTGQRNGLINQQQYWNTIVGWQGQVSTITGTEHVLASSDTKSFTSFFGTADKLNAAFPIRMSANVDSALYLLGRNFLPPGTQVAQNALGTAGLTLVAGAGQFTFAPVPIPAAVILFGSGLVALVGLARRKSAQS